MEVYGVKPKPFTKDWWGYFWDYYKWHTIAVLFVLISIISTAVECAHRINYDLQADFITETTLSDEQTAALTALIEENIDDITKNGKSQAFITVLSMGESVDPQYNQAMYTKFSVEMGYTESFVFLASEKYARQMGEAGVFEAASNWCDTPSLDGYCVSLEGCKPLEEIGIDTSDLYIGVISMRERDKEAVREKNLPQQENGIKFAKFLISKR